MLEENAGKLANTGVSGLLRFARNDGEKSYSSKIWRSGGDSNPRYRYYARITV